MAPRNRVRLPASGAYVFPTTPASAVLGIGSDDPLVRGRAFAAVVRAYWKPVYRRVRLRHRKSQDDAKDLTQGFFALALERGSFGAYDQEQARFRTYVRRCVDNFVISAERSRSAQKRGGASIALALDFDDAEREIAGMPPSEESLDERAFDRDWIASLHDRSVETIREALRSEGRDAWLAVFERYDLADEDERPSYRLLAEELGVKVTDVTNWLHAVRKRLRATVLETLREITATEEEFRSEALELLGIDLHQHPD